MRHAIEPLLGGIAVPEVWLFGALARGDWDSRSDVDPLATGLADDVIGLQHTRKP